MAPAERSHKADGTERYFHLPAPHLADLVAGEQLLIETTWSATEIARMLAYAPSNVNKFFKKYVGLLGRRRSE